MTFSKLECRGKLYLITEDNITYMYPSFRLLWAEHHKVEGSNKTVVTIHMCEDGDDREFKSEELDDFERDNVLDKLYTVYL